MSTELVEVIPSNMAVITKVELDTAIATAKAYPRDLVQFLNDAKSIVTSSEKIAASCMYTLKRKNYNKDTRKEEEKIIEGKSIRLAEILFSCYGNLKAATRIVSNDGKTVKVEAAVIDLQKNNTYLAEQARSILKSDGKSYSNDMQVLTTNAASAIAFRNAIYKAIPGSFSDEVYDHAKRKLNGSPDQLKQRIEELTNAFVEAGLDIKDYLKYYKINSVDEIKTGHVGALFGMLNAIKDGVFDNEEETKQTKAKSLNEELKNESEEQSQSVEQIEAEEQPQAIESQPISEVEIKIPEALASVLSIIESTKNQKELFQTMKAINALNSDDKAKATAAFNDKHKRLSESK